MLAESKDYQLIRAGDVGVWPSGFWPSAGATNAAPWLCNVRSIEITKHRMAHIVLRL